MRKLTLVLGFLAGVAAGIGTARAETLTVQPAAATGAVPLNIATETVGQTGALASTGETGSLGNQAEHNMSLGQSAWVRRDNNNGLENGLMLRTSRAQRNQRLVRAD